MKIAGLTFFDGRVKTTAQTVDWRARLTARKFGGRVTIGTAATQITGGGAGTVIDLEQPEGVVSVRKGYTLIPDRISVQCGVPLLASDTDKSEIYLAADVLSEWPATGTRTDEAIFCTRTTGHTPVAGESEVPGVVAASAFTGDTTTPVLGMDLDRSLITGDVQGTPASALWTPLALLHEPVSPDFIVGPAAMYLYWFGTVATTGYAQIKFFSVPTDLLDELFL